LEDARLHGGWLQVWGEPGIGAQFRLTLPRRAGEHLRSSPLALQPDDIDELPRAHGQAAPGADSDMATVPDGTGPHA
jgi:two-component system sensor histidine kinase MtrB